MSAPRRTDRCEVACLALRSPSKGAELSGSLGPYGGWMRRSHAGPSKVMVVAGGAEGELEDAERTSMKKNLQTFAV